MSIALLLKRALPGAKASINGHIDRGERIAAAIQEQFQISEPHQWQVKHLREGTSSEVSDAALVEYLKKVLSHP